MSTYGFRVKRKDFEISIKSNSAKLIKEEYQKFAADFLGVSLNDILSEAPQSVSTIAETEPTVTAEDKKTNTIKTVENLGTTSEEKEKNVAKSTKATTKKKKELTKLPANFATLLAEKSEIETNNVIEKKTSELKNTYVQMQNIIKEKTMKDELDYIVVAAYCLTHYENMLHFPEEQIKAKIAPFFKKKVSHDIVLDAVAKNLIKVIPDFTGFSDEIEYELTEQGEEYFLNEL